MTSTYHGCHVRWSRPQERSETDRRCPENPWTPPDATCNTHTSRVEKQTTEQATDHRFTAIIYTPVIRHPNTTDTRRVKRCMHNNNNNNNNNNKNLGTMNASAYGFLAGLGQKISAISGDDRETCYLFQRISVLIQRFNATLLHESFADENRSDD